MPRIIAGSLMRLTPPAARMSAGMRSKAMTAHAPASCAIFACSGEILVANANSRFYGNGLLKFARELE